ncbi:MAG TPA: Gfo/Idh/MocA family oxidoreductase [Herbaspirillum sp.]|jgi:phthalate 4,5-cis-dihydrodiol dehydrogenase
MIADTVAAQDMHEDALAKKYQRKIRLGVAGLGRGFMAMFAPLALHPGIQLVACADPRQEARDRFESDFSAIAYETVEALCNNSDVEAIYIATPHQCHREHVELAAKKGKHILVEKPMALTLDDCQAMYRIARECGVKLLVGHSHGFDRPIKVLRELIASREFGPVGMINAINFTDFLYRPRRIEELSTEHGGGVVFSQASHQVDIVRLLGGGRVRSVRANTGNWDAARPTETAYSALMTFEDGLFASLTYSGNAHFDADELCGWIGENGLPKNREKYGEARRLLKNVTSAEDEEALKRTRNYGSIGYVGMDLEAVKNVHPRYHEHFGSIIVSCQKADLRPDSRCITIYGNESRRVIPLGEPAVPRSEVIDELYDAVVSWIEPVHSGEWGTANLEVCLAFLQSAREQRDIPLQYQVAVLDTSIT